MNSTTKIIAGVAVLALLFAGIGYAISYTADTTVPDNTIDNAYITVDEGLNDESKGKLLFKPTAEEVKAAIPYNTTTNAAGEIALKAQNDATVCSGGAIVVKTYNVTKETCTITLTEVPNDYTKFNSAIIDDRFVVLLNDVAGNYNAGVWTFENGTMSASGASNTVTLKTAETGDLSFDADELAQMAAGLVFDIHVVA